MKAFSLIVVLLAVSVARCAHAAPQSPAATLSQAEQDYCHAYAESEYQAAVKAGNGLPDAAYEGAQDECEFQWLIVEAQWNEDEAVDNIAKIAVLNQNGGCYDLPTD